MDKRAAFIGLFLLLAAPAQASSLTVTLLNQKSAGVGEAVVTFTPAGGEGVPITGKPADPLTVNQRDLTFMPFISVVPRNTQVSFLNEDSVLHHVFSFSPIKRFSLKLFGTDETQSVVFDEPGVVVVGCNIHDNMIAYLKVVDTPFAGKTDADGSFTLEGLPPGPGQLTVWHPLMKGRGNQLTAEVVIGPDGQALEFKKKFRRGARPVGDY
ncbi:MAG: carboxypeptidase regulatory-like domain-containing protein [Pseudomonadota bacterium]